MRFALHNEVRLSGVRPLEKWDIIVIAIDREKLKDLLFEKSKVVSEWS